MADTVFALRVEAPTPRLHASRRGRGRPALALAERQPAQPLGCVSSSSTVIISSSQ